MMKLSKISVAGALALDLASFCISPCFARSSTGHSKTVTTVSASMKSKKPAPQSSSTASRLSSKSVRTIEGVVGRKLEVYSAPRSEALVIFIPEDHFANSTSQQIELAKKINKACPFSTLFVENLLSSDTDRQALSEYLNNFFSLTNTKNINQNAPWPIEDFKILGGSSFSSKNVDERYTEKAYAPFFEKGRPFNVRGLETLESQKINILSAYLNLCVGAIKELSDNGAFIGGKGLACDKEGLSPILYQVQKTSEELFNQSGYGKEVKELFVFDPSTLGMKTDVDGKIIGISDDSLLDLALKAERLNALCTVNARNRIWLTKGPLSRALSVGSKNTFAVNAGILHIKGNFYGSDQGIKDLRAEMREKNISYLSIQPTNRPSK